MKFQITACIVTYNNETSILINTIKSFLNTNLSVKLYIVDNSPTDQLKNVFEDSRIEYIHNPSNPGFGSAHNIAIKKAANEAPYHIILNPDIYFNNGVNESIISYLNENLDVGVLMPKVLYPNGNLQYLAKLIPSPIDFFIRRLIPVKIIREKLSKKFELRFSNYDKIMDTPYLSGCFMFFRTSVLKNINGFDENIFMHMEDLDITRRVNNAGYRSIFYPKVFVFHDHLFKNFNNLKTLKIYVKSAVYYFNKWGWFIDKQRVLINKKTLGQFTTE